MIHIKRLYKQLTNFLNTKEEYRREVTDWYEGLNTQNLSSAAEVDDIQKRAKEKIENSIEREPTKITFNRSVYGWSAAAAVVLGGYFVWNTYFKMEVATHAELAQVAPARERAFITLEDGQQIDLDQLDLNQSLQVGNTIIKKDDQGKVSYHDVSGGKEKVQVNSLHVPKAATYQLTLTDGTRVTLNSDSKISYPSAFGDGDRTVQLEGEAYFEVTKTSNKSRFIVESSRQRVQVLGTKFNVKSYADDSKVLTTLAEGSVVVYTSGQHALLKPSQQAQLTDENQMVTKTVNLEDALSWRANQFCFDGSNTAEVLQEIARWYDIDIDYQPKHKAGQYTGKIPRNLSLDKLIELLNYAELTTKPLMGRGNRINLIIT